MLRFPGSLLLGAFLAILSSVQAAGADPVQQHNAGNVWFGNWIGLANARLVVAAPNGEVTEIYASTGTPVFKLDRATAVDGVYRYELRADVKAQAPTYSLSNKRLIRPDSEYLYKTGHFLVQRRTIINPRIVAEEEEG